METLVYSICIAVASFAVLAEPVVAQGSSNTLPLTYPSQVLQGDGNQTCPTEEQRERGRNAVKNAIRSLLRESVTPFLQSYTYFCGGSAGWKRIAYLNMSDPSQQCPTVWQEITTPFRVCGRRSSSGSCEGVTYMSGGEQYDRVCGRITGYQIGYPDAFSTSSQSIDNFYADGISVTQGSPRQHIWTFAAGVDEQTTYPTSTCPCVVGSRSGSRIPSFVGRNYFCESGLTRFNNVFAVLFSNGDPLWDGQGCGPTSSCCTFNSPPWFNVQLSSPTTDDIEVRICGKGLKMKILQCSP